MDSTGLLIVDPSEVTVLQTPPAFAPAASHAQTDEARARMPQTVRQVGRGQTPAAIRASGTRPDVAPTAVSTFGDNALTRGLDSVDAALQGFQTGAAKSVGRMAYNLGRGAVQYTPIGDVSRAIYGDDLVNAAFGLPSAKDGEVPPPEYGGFDDLLQYHGGAEHAGGTFTDLATALLPVGGEMSVAGRAVPGLARAGAISDAAVAKLASSRFIPVRALARLPMAAREAAVGGLLGQAQANDFGTGAALGGVLGGVLGARPLAAQTAAADRALEGAKTQVGRAIAPASSLGAKSANKVFIEQNAEKIARQVPWGAGLKDVAEQAGQLAADAGTKIDAAMDAARQGDMTGLLRSAGRDLKRATKNLLTKVRQGTVQLAPKTVAQLEMVDDALRSLNPKDTNLTTLRMAHNALTDAIGNVGMEVTSRGRQAMGWAGNALNTAVQGGAVSRARSAMRGARGDVTDLFTQVSGTRTETQPLIDALEQAKLQFGNVNAAGQFVASDEGIVRKIAKLQRTLRQYGPEISADSLRSLRQQWDNIVAGPNGKGWLLQTFADESTRGAFKQGANVARDAMGQLVPDIVPHNAEYHFQNTLHDVVSDTLNRRVGQTGGFMKSLSAIAGMAGISLGHGPVGWTAGSALLMPKLVELVKSPEFQLLSAKSRLFVADAIRSGKVDAMRQAVMRMIVDRRLQAEGVSALAQDAMSEAEYQQSLDQLANSAEPAAAVAGSAPALDYAPGPTRAPQVSGYDDTVMGDEPDTTPQPGPEEAHEGDVSALGLPGDHTQLAGVSGLPGPLVSLLHAANTPLASAPDLGPDHPVAQKFVNTLAGFTSPMDLAFLAESAARPLAAGTRFAPVVEGVGRGVSGAMALSGAQQAEEGLQERRPGKVLGGALQAGLGAAGMRAGGVLPAAGEAARAGVRLADRVGSSLAAAGTQAAVGPMLGGLTHVLGGTELAKRLIPDDETRNAVVSAALVAGGAASLANVATATNKIRLGVKPESRAASIFKGIHENGGYTVDVKTGEIPTTGTMVGLYPNGSDKVRVIDVDKFSPADITKFVRANRAELAKPDRYLGAWIDNGKVYLDTPQRVVDVSMSDQLRRATKIGEGPDQMSPDPQARAEGAQLGLWSFDKDPAGNMVGGTPVGSWRGFVESPEFRGRMDEMEAIGRAFLQTKQGRDWWDLHGTDVERVYGKENVNKFAGYLAATAPRVGLDMGTRLATHYMQRDLRGEPVYQPGTVADADAKFMQPGEKLPIQQTHGPNAARVQAGKFDELQADKVNNQYRALVGDPLAKVLDVYWARLAEDPARGIYTDVGEGKITNPKQYRVVADAIDQAAAARGMTPRDYSANVWTGVRETIRNTGELYGQRLKRNNAMNTESVGYAEQFTRAVKAKADALGISVSDLERRLRSGDANLLAALLSTSAGLAAYRAWQQGGGQVTGDARTPAQRRAGGARAAGAA